MTRKLLLKNAAELVTCRGNGPKTGAAMAELGIVADGAMWIEDGVIRRVGTTAEVLSGLDASDAEVVDAAGRGYVLETGHIVLAGTAQDLHGDEAVKRAYLGG